MARIEVAEGSAAGHVRRQLPARVALVAALETEPARLLEAIDIPLDCDEFVCRDSPEARARARALLARLPGLRPLDAGSLEAARTVERMTVPTIALDRRHGTKHARYRIVGV